MLISYLLRSLALALLMLLNGLQAQDASSMRAERGFRVERVAGGEHLAGAQDFAFDAQGQPWVLVAGERLLVLDPRVNGQRVFAAGLQQATSFVLAGDGVLLADASGIKRLTAEDDAGQQLYGKRSASGLVVSDMVWSLDGYVYGALDGAGRWSAAPEVELEAGIFRFRSDGSSIEQVSVVAGGVSSLDVNWNAEVFFGTRQSPLAHVVFPARALPPLKRGSLNGWQALPGVPSSALSNALHAYGGGTWPVEFEGNLFLANSERGELRRFGTQALGSSFRALSAPGATFLLSADKHFRPVALAGGPSGGLYVLDARETGGSLWRVQHVSRGPQPEPPIPALDPKQPAALLPELANANLWHRLHVQRMLHAADLDGAALSALSGMARNSESSLIQLHALWLGAGGAEYLAWCLNNYEASVRRNALALAEDRYAGGRLRIPPGSIISLVHDASARVRLQSLLTWRVALGASSMPDLVRLYPSLRDEASRALALSIALRHPVAVQQAVFRGAAHEAYLPFLGDLAEHVARLGSGRDLISMLLTLSAGEELPALQARILTALFSHSRERDKPSPSPRVSSAFRRLGDSDALEVCLATLPLAEDWAGGQISGSKYRAWIQRALDTLEAQAPDLDARVAAARALLFVPSARERGMSFAALLLGLKLEDRAQVLLIEALASGAEPQAGAILLHALQPLQPRARALVREKLIANAQWVGLLLDALEAGEPTIAAMDQDWQSALTTHADAGVAERARLVFASLPAPEAGQ